MNRRCDYCGFAIREGQKPVVVIATGAVYHRPCARVREERMAKKESNSRFGEIKSSKVKFSPGEPVFVVRGTDPFATNTIIEYARQCEREGAAREVVDDAFDHAMRVAEWQRQNPELVTPLPE